MSSPPSWIRDCRAGLSMRRDEKTTKITLKFPTGVGCDEKVGAEVYRPALIAISFSLPEFSGNNFKVVNDLDLLLHFIMTLLDWICQSLIFVLIFRVCKSGIFHSVYSVPRKTNWNGFEIIWTLKYSTEPRIMRFLSFFIWGLIHWTFSLWKLWIRLLPLNELTF